MPLVLVERSGGAGFNEIYFVRFGLRMGEILNFKRFLSLKIQIIHKKTNQVLKRKKVENVVTIESLSLNSNMKTWDLPLVLLERSQWVGFNGIYFVSSGLRMWEISKFKWLKFSLQIQINYKKPKFGRKFSIENVVTIASPYFALQKLDTKV